MGKKGSKRKTRWRTLSIGAPPGEEDGEEGELRNGYNARTQENGTNSRLYERQNGQNGGYNKGGYRNGPGNHHHSYNSTVSGKGKRNDDSMETNSQPKIIFNEDEYTRITTPRQDVLFKKGYLSKKKPWASTASTSATPSTTESQSASHSTADGSETTEDQQLLDRDCVPGDYPPMSEPPQVGYGTFYDHACGYYYEYPVLVVGPALPGQMVPSALAAVPCGPVPLRPIEWVNPAFVPKLSGQQYCLMDCQGMPTSECAALADAPLIAPLKSESLNGTESTGGTGSCGGSVAEDENNTSETIAAPPGSEDQVDGDPENIVQNGPTSYLEEQEHMNRHMVSSPAAAAAAAAVAAATTPIPQAQPLHMTHMVPAPAPGSAVAAPPQPYLYPGHYMFGPPLVNVNGVTIQSLPMVRSTDISSISSSRRRKKKKRRKQRRPPMGDEEEDEEEEEEYSSEYENNLSSSRLAWPEGAGEIIPSSDRGTNRPLNPECQEFEPQTALQPTTTPSADSEPAGTTSPSPLPTAACCNGHEPDPEPPLDSPKTETDVVCREETPNSITSQTTTTVSSSEHPITDAVTEWLKRANSDSNASDVFVTTKFLKEEEEDEEDDEDEEEEDEVEEEAEGEGKEEKEPPKNLQGNPMPALSVEARVDDFTRKSSTLVDCGGGFAKVVRTTSAGSSNCIGGRRRRKRRRNKGHQDQDQDQDVCESTGQEDSVAGVRVALNSRMTEMKRRSRRRTRPEAEPVEDLKILCVNANHVETEVSVKTFEKGEIVVSVEGNKLLPGTIPFPKHEEAEETIEEEEEEEVEGESFDKNSIEELDVLECWEEPVITPRRMQSKGVLREGEAEEEEEEQLLEEIVDNLEYVKKYYTLAREIDGGSSVEEDDKSAQNCNRAVPKTPEKMIASLCHEEVPRIGDSTGTKPGAGMVERELEVDEAFEVYESCYTDKSRLGLRVNGNLLPSLTPQEPPVPCKAVCCSIQ